MPTYVRGCQVLEADVGTEAGVALLAQEISARYGTVDYVVTAIGSWWQKGVPC